jgi:biopolymer transport protein ExbB/TolQ
MYLLAESQLHYVWSRAPNEGRAILIVLMVFSIFAWSVMVSKYLQMRRAKKLNQFFDAEFRAKKNVI